MVLHHEQIFDINHGANDEKGHNWRKTKASQQGSPDEGICFRAEGKEKGQDHHEQDGRQRIMADAGQDIGWHIDLDEAGEEAAKNQVASHVKKFINGLNQGIANLGPTPLIRKVMAMVFFFILLENGFPDHKAPENPQNQGHQNRTEGPKEGKTYRIAKGGVGSKENDGIDDRGRCQEGNGCVSRDLLFQKAIDDRNNPAFT